MNDPMLGDDLREIRLQAKLHQTELAARLNVSQGTVSRIERGVGTTSELLERWALECGAEVRIARPDAADSMAHLRAALAKAADGNHRALVERAALALASLPAEELEQEARILELRAQRYTKGPAATESYVATAKRK